MPDCSTITFSDALVNIEKLFTIVGIVLAGVWSYLKFIRGQVFSTRLCLGISGTFFNTEKELYLLIKAVITNKNNSPANLKKTVLQKEGTALLVFVLDSSKQEAERMLKPVWKQIEIFRVFEDIQWLEPDESGQALHLISLPAGTTNPIRIHLRVVSRGMEWNDEEIVIPKYVGPEDK